MSLEELKQKYSEFKQERDWEKFHEPKNLAMSISIEAGELMELFQWKDNVDIQKIKNREELVESIEEELADILMYTISMAEQLDIDLAEAVENKLEHNQQRYDIETAKEMTEKFEEWKRD